MKPQTTDKIHFVTGRLAETSLRRVVAEVAGQGGFEASVQVMPITVAALMTPDWIARHLQVPQGTTRIVLPGYCDGDWTQLQRLAVAPIERGPKDLRRLPEHFGQQAQPAEYGRYDIEIVAEINHCPRLEPRQVIAQAHSLCGDGADVIDVGCEPDGNWQHVGDCVRALRAEGFRVSVDSLQPEEIGRAVGAGAELVLSVNSSNCHAASQWGAEVVVIPDRTDQWQRMESTIEFLTARGIPLRVDPVLEPIGLGMAQSLVRYAEARRRWPDAEMLMGTGNLTELTDVDSAGINLLLMAFCQELEIRSVLTTQVINWARSSVKECHLARQLVHYAQQNRTPPKNVNPRLIALRDPQICSFPEDELQQLAMAIRDWNVRILAERGEIHALAGGKHFHDADPFSVFDQLQQASPKPLTAAHAFYLGYETCKAAIALVLNKEYRQDEALRWGFLTVEESDRHRLSVRGPRDTQ